MRPYYAQFISCIFITTEQETAQLFNQFYVYSVCFHGVVSTLFLHTSA